MQRILTVVDHTDRSIDLLKEMAQIATGIGAELTVLSLLTEEEFENYEAVIAEIERSERTTYTHEKDEVAVEIGEQEIESKLDSVEYDTLVGRVVENGERADEILAVADEIDADHVALVGRKRSPTGKALFGDAAQGVILNFNGYVTVSMV